TRRDSPAPAAPPDRPRLRDRRGPAHGGGLHGRLPAGAVRGPVAGDVELRACLGEHDPAGLRLQQPAAGPGRLEPLAELWLPPAGGAARGVSSLHRRDIHGTSITVPLVTVDGLGLAGVTFMKIDVDGHEIPVLRGAEDTIKRDQPRLLIEVEQRIQPVTDVTGLLESWGYRGWVRPRSGWLPMDKFPLAAHQASTSRV